LIVNKKGFQRDQFEACFLLLCWEGFCFWVFIKFIKSEQYLLMRQNIKQ